MPGIGTAPPAPDEETPFHTYQFGPFRLESEIAIPELQGSAGAGRRTVKIVAAAIPAELQGASNYGTMCQVAAEQYLLNIPGVAGFHVTGGNLVRVQIAPGASAADVSTYLLGSVFGALCHQNGLLPLHASSVRTGAGVTAFLGDSGTGKSTLAACLQGRGYSIISDDICVLEEDADGTRVIPVAGWLKLWRTSLNHLGETPDERHRVYSEDDKYRLYLSAQAADRPELRNLIFLSRATDPGSSAALETLTNAETLARMMQLTYLGYITELTGSHARVFQQCAKVLAGAKGYKLTVPWGFGEMDGVLDLLERELLAIEAR